MILFKCAVYNRTCTVRSLYGYRLCHLVIINIPYEWFVLLGLNYTE